MSTWEERMSAKARVAAGLPDPLEDPGPMPTEDPHCCCEWRLDMDIRWLQFVVCDYQTCDHEHHKGEVLLA